MTTTQKTLTITGTLALALALTVAAGTALARGGHGAFLMQRHSMKAACMHSSVSNLIDDLELGDQQQAHVEAVHELLEQRLEQAPAVHDDLRRTLVDNLRTGSLDPTEARHTVDLHLEQLRALSYQVTDELVALVNSLDEHQRATLLAHLEEAPCGCATDNDRQSGHLGGHHGGHSHGGFGHH